MGRTVQEELSRRQSENLTTLVHVQGDPESERVRELADEARDMLSADDAPPCEGWEAIVSAPEDAAVLIEISEDDIEGSLFDEFKEKYEIHGSEEPVHKIQTDLVILSKQFPDAVSHLVDLRVRITDNGTQWTRVQYHPHIDDVYEKVIHCEA